VAIDGKKHNNQRKGFNFAIELCNWLSTGVPPDHIMINFSKQEKSRSNLTG
jgi:hypothetical protein